MKVIVFDLGGTLMEYAGMPNSWVDYYMQGFEAINEKYNLGASELDIMKSVSTLKEFNPRISYREKEYLPECRMRFLKKIFPFYWNISIFIFHHKAAASENQMAKVYNK